MDPRASIEDSVRVAGTYGANLLLAELVGAAVYHQAPIRVSAANAGSTWARVMDAEGVDFGTVQT